MWKCRSSAMYNLEIRAHVFSLSLPASPPSGSRNYLCGPCVVESGETLIS
jgi:hypothetical protein